VTAAVISTSEPERLYSGRELRDTARELPNLRLYACAASVETTASDAEGLEVMSTPRFLREVAGECLLFV
jgi:hypothetical protein